MNNFKIALRNILNPKENNLIKIFSLGVGFAMALVLFAKVSFDLSYNSFYPHSDRIYTVFTNMEKEDEIKPYPQVSGGVVVGMKAEVPEVEAATRFTYLAGGTFYDKERNKLQGTFILADSCLFDLVPRPMIVGNAKEVLSKPMYALVAKSIADNMGGDVIGQQIEIDSRPGKMLTIGGVFEDIPENAHHKYDVIVSMASIDQFIWNGSNNWLGNDRYIGYVKLKKNTDPNTLSKAFRQMQVKYQDIEKVKDEYNVDFTYQLNKLSDVTSYYPEVKQSILLLSLLGITLLFVAIMNYMLFVISGLIDTGKSVAVYKTYGATKMDISIKMITNTFLHFFLSICLAVVLIAVFKGIIKDMFYVEVTDLFSFQTSATLAFIIILIFVATAIVPANMLSSIPVIATISSFRKNRKNWKLALLWIQFVASAFLITLLSIVALQYDKMVKEDHGFDYANLVYTQIRHPQNNVAIEEIKQLPFVELVSKASDLPLATGFPSGNNVSIPGQKEELFNIADFYWVDENFIPTMNIKVIEGANFTHNSTQNEILVSKTFDEKMRYVGWNDGVVGKDVEISEHGICRIVGVYDDFAIASFTNSLRKPSAVFYNPDATSSIVVKMKEVNGNNIAQIQKIFGNVMPERDIQIISYSESFVKQYDKENKFRNSVIIIGIIILIVNMTGLVGYISNEARRRSSEVAVRKINGATLFDILSLFIINILWLIVPALIVGNVVAYYIASKWMEHFAIKVSINAMLFVGCSAFLTVLIIVVVAFNCIKTANQNPVESLKAE